MSSYLVKPSKLYGEIRVPPSKSHTLRAILFGALAHGKTFISHALASPDTEAMIQACRQIGASVLEKNGQLEIVGVNGKIQGASGVIDAGNSGIVLRFMTAVAAHSPTPIQLTGDSSQRPMQPLLTALNQLGVKVTSNNGLAPLIVQGPLKPGLTCVMGEDSQFVSALLIAGILCEGTLEVEVKNAGEKPWVALTLDWLRRLTIAYENRDYSHYKVFGKPICGFQYEVPGDFSSAAFPLIASLATQSELTIPNLDMTDPQGDKRIIPLLQQMGANIRIVGNKVTIKPSDLKGIFIDVNDCIDALPALAVAASFAKGKTELRNAKVARTKECDRIHALATELKKMGTTLTELEDGLILEGSSLQGSAHLFSHRDHRMAMALTVAALGARGQSRISEAGCVAKTFPTFAEEMKRLGADIEVVH